MLSINWDDVINVLRSLHTQLIIIGVVLALAIIMTIAAHWLKRPERKLLRSTTWVAAVVAVALAVTSMMYGGLKTILDLSSGSGVLSAQTTAMAEELGNAIADEGMVLLKNDNATLPLEDGAALNVLGWASTNPVYGGTGSGSLNADNPTTTLLDGLTNAGFELNTTLTDLYTRYRDARPEVGMFAADWSLPEPTAEAYTSDVLSSIREHSDTAVVVISRSGGEGFDLPQDVNAEVAANPAFAYTNNSSSEPDFDDGQGYLELTNPEEDLIEVATQNAEKVVVVINAANAFQLGELADNPEIDAIIWALPPGQVGFNALGRILDGEVNPSGRTPDTFAYDISSSPAANNFGAFDYTNMEEFAQTSVFTGATTLPGFVSYNEGIYVGYRWYETAAAEGVIDYESTVVYPFGYGLSYTTFNQELVSVEHAADGEITVTVTVTNTGDVAGKDVVEIYYTPPYTNGGIERASVNLVEYAKTALLEPGQCETVTLTFEQDDMASYDENGAKAYVLEAGDYVISLRSDSHTLIAAQTLAVAQTLTYDTADNTHDGDVLPATNAFDEADGGVTYLSRADGFANYAEATAAPTDFELSEALKATFINNDTYDAAAADAAAGEMEMPTTGADNGLVLGDLYGLAYDDPKWSQLLDQLTVEEMNNLIANGGYGSVAIGSVGKLRVSDVDGPAALNNNFTGVGSIGLPVSVAVAATWNKDLAHDFGTAIGTMAHDMDVAGWYAPATNTHRYAYAGRNFEYFSEDPLLAGTQVAQEIQGAAELDVYAFIKHFALNDQESKRTDMLMTWSNEQAIREIYLRSFEIGIKEGGAGAVMTAFNYIGTVYAGAHPGLQQTVLREEWGFTGMTLTDYFGGYGYQNADQLVRNGGDMMLATTDIGVNYVRVTDSPAAVAAMREASHNILYTVANSWVYAKGQPEVERARWEYLTWTVLGIGAVLLIGLEAIAVRRFLARRSEVSASGKEAVK